MDGLHKLSTQRIPRLLEIIKYSSSFLETVFHWTFISNRVLRPLTQMNSKPIENVTWNVGLYHLQRKSILNWMGAYATTVQVYPDCANGEETSHLKSIRARKRMALVRNFFPAKSQSGNWAREITAFSYPQAPTIRAKKVMVPISDKPHFPSFFRRNKPTRDV